MNGIALLNLLSLIILFFTLGWIFFKRKLFPEARWIKSPLVLAVSSYAFINLSNVLEHSGITSFFDPIEDIVEILFLVLFIFFVFGYRAFMYLREVMDRENWLHSAMDSLHGGIIATDQEGHIHYVNSKIEEMTGRNREELLNRKTREILDFCDKEKRNPLEYNPFNLDQTDEKEEKYPAGIYLKSGDGNLTLVLCHVSPVRDREGNLLGMIGIFNDVGPYYSMMEQLNHLQKMKAIGQLTSGVAHDLNNMLGGITGAAELLQSQLDKYPGEKNRELIDIIFYSVDNAKELTANLLSFGRKDRILSTAVELGGILHKATVIAQRTIDKLVSIKLISPEEELTITGDPAQLQNAFLNLILNARDAQPQGGKIRISTDRRFLDREFCDASNYPLTPGEYAVVKVCDRGTGIDPSIMDRVFEPFFTTKEKGKGTGLGLAAVNNTVMNHNGAMEIGNRKRGGCCFTLYFPLKASLSLSRNESTEKAGKEMNNRRILIIDDESIIRTTARLMLEEENIFCETAESGQEGIDILAGAPRRFDAVILDLVMPRTGGKETAERIHMVYPELPIIWMSGFNQNEKPPPYIKGFLKKPFRKKEILELLSDVL